MQSTTGDSPLAPAAQASRIRYRVLSLAVLLAFITYLDRVCISKLRRRSCAICRSANTR